MCASTDDNVPLLLFGEFHFIFLHIIVLASLICTAGSRHFEFVFAISVTCDYKYCYYVGVYMYLYPDRKGTSS